MSYDVTSRTVTLSHDGLAIHTLVYEPQDAKIPVEGLPAVICSHGFRSTFAGAEPYAKAIAAEDYLSVAFDFCGGGMGSLSAGDPSHMSVVTECQDLSCVVDYVQRLDEVDSARLALLGQSQGGLVSSLLASRKPRSICALLLLYPAFVIHDDMKRLFGSPHAVPMLFRHMDTTLGRIYATDAMAWEPYSHLESFRGPVHIWHGDADELVPLDHPKRAAQAFPNAELTVVPGAGHGFGERREEVIPQLIDFLRRRDSSR